MDRLEKVELIREKCGVSYEDARAALDASGDDVLDAIIWLERAGKAQPRSATFTTGPDEQVPVSSEMVAAQSAYQESSRRSTFTEQAHSFWESLKRICRKSVETKFVATRAGVEVATLPLIVPLVGLVIWGATIWLLIIGLFFGLRYHIVGVERITVDVNGAMDKAADVAETIKKDVTGND